MKTDEKISILLVDDRPENLISLSAVLDSPEYNLVTAGSGMEALRCILNQDFALILLDVQMPILDGFETAKLIKQREKSRSIPIIFITALSVDEPFLFKGYSSGAVDYIAKPIDPTILRSKVAVFADLHRKTLQIESQARALRESELAKLEVKSLKRERAAYRKYRDLVDGLKNGIVWTADPRTLKITFVSAPAERILGLPLSEWFTSEGIWADHLHPDDREAVMECLRRKVFASKECSFEHRVLRSDGEVIWFNTAVKLHEPEDAEEAELRGLSVDVTHLKNAEELARQAIQARDEFLSIASHELKTPLTPLKLQLQVMKKSAAGELNVYRIDPKLQKTLVSAERQVDRLSKLVEELLDVSRINNGKLYLELERFDLREMVRDVCARFSDDLARVNCALHLDLPEQPVIGNWDRLRIEQVFVNLLTNAQKYGAGKPIHVRVGVEGDRAHLTIVDQGIGIAKEDQVRIFSQYERAVSAAHFGGLGLGLYIVGQILQAHQGKIWVESDIGSGSVFHVMLPLAAQLDASPELGRDPEPRGLVS